MDAKVAEGEIRGKRGYGVEWKKEKSSTRAKEGYRLLPHAFFCSNQSMHLSS